jgi:hypothetical protein
MNKLKEAPRDYIAVVDLLQVFGISWPTYWRYVKRGLLPPPKLFRARPSEKSKKVKQAFTPPETLTRLGYLMDFRSSGFSLDSLEELFKLDEEFISVVAEIRTYARWSLPYLSPIFRFDTRERMLAFYEEFETRHKRKWIDSYEDFKHKIRVYLENEIAHFIAQGTLEFGARLGSSVYHLLRSKCEQDWFKKNWDIYQKTVPSEMREKLKFLYEKIIRDELAVTTFATVGI